MRLEVGSGTDVGQVRALNEDGLLVTASLFAVADGMGGHRGGEVASARALAAFETAATEPRLETLMRAVQAANTDVYEHARSTPELAGMGTTLCALAPLDAHRVAIVNVGDSRVYLHRDRELHQISEDHSFVETLVREGRLTRAQADVHPQRNVITRALGIESHLDVDGWEVVVAAGDRFLLCSDGLFNEVDDLSLERILTEVGDPIAAAGRLVEAANTAGGRDNITCVIVDVVDVEPGGPSPTPVGRPVGESAVRRSSAADLDETTVDEPTVRATTESTPGGSPADGTGQTARRRRRPTWRTIVFLSAVVAVFAVAGVAWFLVSSNQYTVAESNGNVAIFKGPRDGLVGREVVDEYDLPIASLDDATRRRVRSGQEFPTRALARQYADRLEDRFATTTTTSTTPATTTTVETTPAPTETTPQGP
ncbi:MAG TPA: Stp1/IreP family PP2C-type Ser/Thr phosphatase [Microthrixaceae bacterium]|nr:Stp1/IreP family PP2C-type Ser/Thr phosphatase [Microthrixaceae bacterium]HNI33871.1 Stp1/IreP family PP2C-type Ser/Thr phosphatase [Microthrixaceae bacterium]